MFKIFQNSNVEELSKYDVGSANIIFQYAVSDPYRSHILQPVKLNFTGYVTKILGETLITDVQEVVYAFFEKWNKRGVYPIDTGFTEFVPIVNVIGTINVVYSEYKVSATEL